MFIVGVIVFSVKMVKVDGVVIEDEISVFCEMVDVFGDEIENVCCVF